MAKVDKFLSARIVTNELASGDGAPGGGSGDDFRFSAVISTGSLDSYFTRMSESTLQNYVSEAAAGVSLLDSHDNGKLGVGYSYAARRIVEDGKNSVIADFYIPRGIEFGGQHSYKSTDDFIRAIESGTIRDVSVGFYGGDFICDICGEPVFGNNTSCPHFPGVSYDVGGKRVVATAEVVDAHLAEVSLVFKGSNPDSAILEKFARMRGTGSLSDEQLRTIKNRYSIEQKQTKNGEDIMKIPNDVRALLPADVDGENIESAVFETLRTQAAKINELKEKATRAIAERDALAPLADMGKAYKADLVADTLAEGVRAQGEKFPEETYRAMLEASSIEQIKAVRDSFATAAESVLQGTRKTKDNDDESSYDTRETVTPAAHRV